MPTAKTTGTKTADDTEAIATQPDPPSAAPTPTSISNVMLETDDRWDKRSALSSELDAEDKPEEWVLFLYDPLAVGRGKHSEHSITIPVSVTVATQKGQLNTYEYRTLAKGLQRIRKKDRDLIMACTSKPFMEMRRRNVLKPWSDEWELSKMSESDALEAIRRCEQRTLIDIWMEKRNQYTRPVQEDLDKKKTELANPPNLQQI